MFKKLTLALCACLFIANSVSAESPTGGASITSYPAYPNKYNPDHFTVELRPGESAQEVLRIKNKSTIPLLYVLTGVDHSNDDFKRASFKLSTDTQTGTGLWIVPEFKTISLNPGEVALVNFTITVPKDAEMKTYLAGLSVETQKVGTIKQKDGMNLAVNIRKAERIEIKVTDNPQPVEKRPPPSIPWNQLYFMASLGIFLLAILYIGFTQLKKHRAKKRAHKAAAGHAEKGEHTAKPAHHEKK